MNNRMKQVVPIAVAILFTMGLSIEGQSPEGRSARRALEGSWRVSAELGPNRPPTSPATVEALVTYDSGGGLIFTDNTPTSAHGSWEFVGHGRFKTTFVRFILNPAGQIVATLHVRGTLRLNSTNDEATSEGGDVEIRQFPSGIVLAAYDGSTSVATRIRP